MTHTYYQNLISHQQNQFNELLNECSLKKEYSQLDEKNYEIIHLNQQLDRNNHEIIHLNQQLDQNNHEIIHLNQQLDQNNHEIIHLNQQLDQNNHEIIHLNQQLDQNNHENELLHYTIDRYETSLSWKITKPLRKLTRILSKSEYRKIKYSGWFDPNYYTGTYEDVRDAGINPLLHFMEYGWKEGRNPSDQFDTNFYLNSNRDVAASGINPLVHFLKKGKKEGRLPREGYPKSISKLSQIVLLAKKVKQNPYLLKKFVVESRKIGPLSAIKQTKYVLSKYAKYNELKTNFESELDIPFAWDGYIFISHDATPTGAPILLYQLAKTYRETAKQPFVILLLRGGEMLDDFNTLGTTLVIDHDESKKLFSHLKDRGYTRCISNTVVTGHLAQRLKENQIKTVFLIHELPDLIYSMDLKQHAQAVADSEFPVVFASHFVAERFVEHFPINEINVHIIPQGIQKELIYSGNKASARARLFQTLGITADPSAKIVLGAGYAQHRKGTDLFGKVAEYCYEKFPKQTILFVWVGNCNDYFQEWRDQILPQLPYRDRLIFVDFQKEVNYFFAASDLFCLSSREDPYPSVALIAFAHHIPVVMFEGTGGICELINNENGGIVPAFETHTMAEKIIGLLDHHHDWHVPVGGFEQYLSRLTALLPEPITLPSVTVIVPNYNYARFLSERLSSILNQTYPIDELIFLDDCSSDNSIDVAEKILKKADIHYQIITNEANIGVYRQWIKGIETARNDLIWIAEADDVAEVEFIQKMIPYFFDNDVALAYAQSSLIDQNGAVIGNALSHTDAISQTKWKENYLVSGKSEIKTALLYRNTIPNVSAAIINKRFLKPTDKETLINYRYTGDWYLYIALLMNGKVGFSHESLNRFRKHTSNVTTTNQFKDSYLTEVLALKEYVYQRMPISEHEHKKVLTFIEKDFLSVNNNPSPEILTRLKTLTSLCSKHITFVTFNQEFGGSEIFWYDVSQYLSQHGFSLTVLAPFGLLSALQQDTLEKAMVKIVHIPMLSGVHGLQEIHTDLVIFSIGDHNNGGDWFEYCHQNSIPYAIVNQLVKEDMWITDSNVLHKIFSGYQNANATFFTCHNNQTIFENKMGNKLPNALIHYNPISINREDYVTYPVVQEYFHLAFPARLLTVHKGQDVLIKTISNPKWKKRNLIINFYGEGPDADFLKKIVKKNNLTNVIFHGHIDNIRNIWENNHGFILTSHMEGIPIVLLGAMFAGRVSIVTDVGGNTEVIKDSMTGFVASRSTVAAVDEALERAWTRRDEWETLGKAARVSILEHYPENPLKDFYVKITKALAW